MKSAFIAVLFCVCVPFTFAGEFHSQFVAATSSVTLPDVPAHHFLRIRNFTQDGGGTRGTVTVTLGTGGTATKVLTAALISVAAPEIINSIVIEGPATAVTVTAGNANCIITYKKDQDAD